MLKLGVQVSIAGKIYKAVDRARELGCNTMQIFSRNPRSFKRKYLNKKDIEEFRKRRKEAKINPLIIHTVYTQNLASSNKRFYNLSIRDFIKDLGEAQSLGAEFVITHMGSFKKSTLKDGLRRVILALERILRKTPYNINILLENTSGSGHWLGSKISQIGYIIENLGKPKNLGMCLDTCHAYCAGYDIRTEKGLNILLEEIEHFVGIERLKVIHLNDTKDPLSSHKDRHWHIGEGRIGLEGFKRIINHPLLKRLPFILETPKKEEEDDLRNLETVRRLYNSSINL